MRSAIILIVLFLSHLLPAQEVEFIATASRDKIGVNEKVSIEFKMNVSGDNFTPPNFNGFQVVSGPFQSFSQKWVNGKGSMNKSYTYVLKPNNKGTLTIKQATMEYDGQVYKTTPIQIKVSNTTTTTSGDMVLEVEDEIVLVAEVSKGKPYLNEPITVVYKLYVANNTGVSGWTEVSSPKYADFWSQNIDNRNRQAQNGTYNGKPYRYLVLREAVLYPQKTGKLIIEPLTLDINVEVPTRRRDFFGRTIYSTTSKKVTSGRRTIDVKAIPTDGRPASYTGAVGQFEFKLETDKAQLAAGESFTASVKVGGKGNLKLMELPKLKVPSSLEMYEPERKNNVNTTISGMRGNISDNYVIVPQYGGKYIIPPVEFSYFDPKKEEFVTIDTGETLIEVDGPAPTGDTTDPVATANKNVIQANDPFAFIKPTTTFTPQERSYFFNTTGYWGIIGGSLLMIPLFLLIRKRQETLGADVVGMRLKTANKLSKKYLSTARKNLGNHEQFYIALEKSLHNYLKSKLNIQTAEMSKDKVAQLLQERGADESTKDQFIQLLSSCEFARYTPSTDATMKQDYDKASTVINAIDKQLKR